MAGVNTNVFTGSDATLTVATDSGPEGAAAKEIVTLFKLSPVGRATNVQICVETDLEEFHEVGQRHPVALQPSNISIHGQIGRAYINGALLRLLLGKGALKERAKEPYLQPDFNLMLDMKDPARPDNTSTLTVHGVRFENWAYELPEETFVMESVTFKGLFITVEDKAK
jgi:hypothetical protein